MKSPINGGAACDDWMLGRMCTPFCNSKFDFSKPLSNSVWSCGGSGTWTPGYRWPDCTSKQHMLKKIIGKINK